MKSHIQHLRRVNMTLGFIFFLVTLIAELAFYLMGTGLELAGGPSLEYLTWHIFLPSGINLVLFLIASMLMKHYKDEERALNYIPVVMLV